jgi:hypothetical protein
VLNLLSNADQSRADAARASQIQALLTSRGPTAELFEDTKVLKAELAQIEARQQALLQQRRLEAVSRGGGSAILPGAPAGFIDTTTKKTATAKAGPDFSNGSQRNAIGGGLESLTGINDVLSDPRYLLEKSLEESLTQLAIEKGSERVAIVDETNRGILDSFLSNNDLMLAAEQAKNQTLGQTMGDLAGMALQQTGALGKIGKAYAIAQTVWSTGTAVMKAMAEVPWPGNIAAAAMVAARGALQLAMIKRTNVGSGGSISSGGGSVSSGSMGNSIPATQPSTESNQRSAVTIVVQGNLIESGSTAQWLADVLGEAINERDMVFINSNSRQALELAGT